MARSVALVTGGSRGLGRALTSALIARGWQVIVDGRDAGVLAHAVGAEGADRPLTPVAGDVIDAAHRARVADAVAIAGRLDLLVNNASALGPSPQPRLADYPLDEFARVFAVNVMAPLALTQLVLPHLLRAGGRVVNISSDAAVEPYAGWGGYGSSKAALDQLTAVLGAEQPTLRVYSFDPGDMATDLQQQAFPGDDISDRATPQSVVPALLRLVEGRLPSGRYRAAELARSAARVSREVLA